MAALPYIQLYVADYLADTMHLSTEEHGAYLLLIMNYWQTGKPIPKNRLPAIAKLSNERWTDVEESLNEFFTEDEQGCWVHSRLEADLARVRGQSKQASKAGKASAAARKAKREAAKLLENKGDSNDRSTVVDVPLQQNGNHTDTDTDTDKRLKKEKRVREPPAKKKPKSAWVLPDFVDSVAWSEFEQHRKLIRKPMSDLARAKATNLLRELTHDEQRRVIDYSIAGGYPGLFPDQLKREQKNADNQQSRGTLSAPDRVKAANRKRQIERGERPFDWEPGLRVINPVEPSH